MILNQVNFYSETLGFLCEMTVLLPQRSLAEAQNKSRKKLRTLYLLHGRSDDHTSWQRYTSIERYVEGLINVAVVMPAVQRSFYTDMVYGGKYWQFISEEAPVVARDLFPLSAERKDNFVAGLSMGGYGAFKLGSAMPRQPASPAASISAIQSGRIIQGMTRSAWQSSGSSLAIWIKCPAAGMICLRWQRK